MNIAALRVRITIQKNVTQTDVYGNHTSAWEDYFSCWATASDQSGSEEDEAGQLIEKDQMDLTVRYSSETAAVTPKGYRVILGEKIYGIEHVDDMGFKKHSRKFHCSLQTG